MEGGSDLTMWRAVRRELVNTGEALDMVRSDGRVRGLRGGVGVVCGWCWSCMWS